jgi:hypothetical protein
VIAPLRQKLAKTGQRAVDGHSSNFLENKALAFAPAAMRPGPAGSGSHQIATRRAAAKHMTTISAITGPLNGRRGIYRFCLGLVVWLVLARANARRDEAGCSRLSAPKTRGAAHQSPKVPITRRSEPGLTRPVRDFSLAKMNQPGRRAESPPSFGRYRQWFRLR